MLRQLFMREWCVPNDIRSEVQRTRWIQCCPWQRFSSVGLNGCQVQGEVQREQWRFRSSKDIIWLAQRWERMRWGGFQMGSRGLVWRPPTVLEWKSPGSAWGVDNLHNGKQTNSDPGMERGSGRGKAGSAFLNFCSIENALSSCWWKIYPAHQEWEAREYTNCQHTSTSLGLKLLYECNQPKISCQENELMVPFSSWN